MRHTEHLMLLILMIPTLVILVAAAVSMANLDAPAEPSYVIATAYLTVED